MPATAVVGSTDCSGRVAEWQTRWLQVPVSFGTWGVKSPFAHRNRCWSQACSYPAVLYAPDGKQTSSSFNDHREAVDFQQLVNRVGPAKAIEIWRTRQPTDNGHTVASWCS